MARKPTKFMGVYQLESAVKRFDGKPDLCFYITYKTPDGKKVWEKVGWFSEKMRANLAADIRADRLQEIRLGETASLKQRAIEKEKEKEAGMTFGEAWAIFDEKWLPNIKRPRAERDRYKNYVKPLFENRPLKSITTLELEDFKASLLKKGLAAASIRLIIGDIRRTYNKMEEWELYSGPMPVRKVKLPKVDNARDRFLTADEAQTLLAAVKKRSAVWYDIAFIALNTGMRLSEILGLRRQDVDMANCIIYLDGKTGKRAVPMNTMVHSVLKESLARHDQKLVFPGKNGQQMGAESATKSFSRAIVDAKLNPDNVDRRHKVVFHTLRHTFCSWLAIEGKPLNLIGEMVGHATTQMTKRYAHLCPDKKKQTVSVIEEVFSTGKATAVEKVPLPRRKPRKDSDRQETRIRRKEKEAVTA